MRENTHTNRQGRRSNKIIIEGGEKRKEIRGEGEENLRGGKEENAYYR